MRILMINVVCGIRSTGRICIDLATALVAQGHEIKIAYGREEVPDKFKKYAVRIGSDFDVKLHGIKARIFDGCGFGSKKATEKFIEWVKIWDPDVIHLHNLHGYYINIEILFSYLRTCGKKIIWTLHDCWAFTGHAAFCEAVNCERFLYGCYNCPNKKEYPKSFVDWSEKNWIKKEKAFSLIPNLQIVTPSDWLSGLVKKSFLKQYSVLTIHNGININIFKKRLSRIKEKYHVENFYIILGVAAIWDKRKGLNDFIRLSKIIDKNKYRIVLVGLTSKQISKLPESIIGVKRTNSTKELSELYSVATVFVNPTYEDNYPTTNIESIACGTPVITYDSGGSGESAILYGEVVAKGDLYSLLNAINNITNSGIKNDIVNRYKLSAQHCVEQYLELY